MTNRFYKQSNTWYIDLPEFLEAGLGTQANLMMVDGADTFLDHLSRMGTEVWLQFSAKPFDTATHLLVSDSYGMDEGLLNTVGHAPVSYGMYYTVPTMQGHRLWLCPVTEYVFQGGYPNRIWVEVVNN